MGLHMYKEMDGVITLNCIIKESPGVVFDITINKNKSILRLKDAIKEKLQDTFRNIDTIGIKLWKVQVAQEDSRLEQLRNPDVSVDNVLDKEEVNEIQRGTDKIGNLFENTDNNNIHVIVQGKENWCSVCGISFKNIALLEDHERNDAHHIVPLGEFRSNNYASYLLNFFPARYKACRSMWKFSQLSAKNFPRA
ncbi:hypothetical protein RhiirB3_532116 [Rhizophagus irregularis]|nr:hypothetical protein RhiirB3_532116 [Rhizophagus irregularis]